MTSIPLRPESARPHPPRVCLIEGRDYHWVQSAREDIHSFCCLIGRQGQRRVAALRPHPERSGWQLLWLAGQDTTPVTAEPWTPQHCRYILDARDIVARRLPRFLVEHPNPIAPAPAGERP